MPVKIFKTKALDSFTYKITRKDTMKKTRMMNILIWCQYSSCIELLIKLKLLLIPKIIKI